MTTVRLIPSTYYLSSSNLSISSASNMYANTDSTSYATITNTSKSTSSYYLYIRGFDFDTVPSNANVTGITIKLKAYHSGGNTSTIYCYDGTSQVSSAGSTTALGTSASVHTFTNTTISWDTLKGYGSDFGIRINCRRSKRNTTAHIYVYGAEIEVTYTLPSEQPELYVKQNGSWVQVQTAYKKVSGSWQQIAVDQAFQSGVNYVKG